MSETDRTSVSSSEFFQKIINELRASDFTKYHTIFHPPEEFYEDNLDPLTLAVVEHNLNEGFYGNNYWSFIREVATSFNLLIMKYSPESQTHKKALELKKWFGEHMDKFMREKGYCCGQWYISQAKEVECSAGKEESECTIREGEEFYRYENFTFCDYHYTEKLDLVRENINLNEKTFIHRSEMIKYVFRSRLAEKMIKCCVCEKYLHERCVLQLTSLMAKYYCKNCRHFKDYRFDKIKASFIRSTPCDRFITKFVERHLRADFSKKFTIRMLSTTKTSLLVDNSFIQACNEIPESIPYTNISIFAFFKDPDGFDILFFTLFAQLYGDDAPASNAKTAYISYIDSVKLYPGRDRTKLYHAIILGLFEFLKRKGYQKVAIWSCPPEKNVDYVFTFKPTVQKIPNSTFLDDWYLSLFEFGKRIGTIDESEGVESFAFHNNWQKISNIPLFFEDLWQIKLTEILSQTDIEWSREEVKFKSRGHAVCSDKNLRIWQLLQVQTKAYDQSYFIVKLKNSNQNEIGHIEGDERKWISSRHALVDFFCDSKLMFNDIRQARFSTYSFLHRILMENSICVHCQTYQDLDRYLLCYDCSQIGKNCHLLSLRP